jgi:hypothetical protein
VGTEYLVLWLEVDIQTLSIDKGRVVEWTFPYSLSPRQCARSFRSDHKRPTLWPIDAAIYLGPHYYYYLTKEQTMISDFQFKNYADYQINTNYRKIRPPVVMSRFELSWKIRFAHPKQIVHGLNHKFTTMIPV